jgi:hypothetical protein
MADPQNPTPFHTFLHAILSPRPIRRLGELGEKFSSPFLLFLDFPLRNLRKTAPVQTQKHGNQQEEVHRVHRVSHFVSIVSKNPPLRLIRKQPNHPKTQPYHFRLFSLILGKKVQPDPLGRGNSFDLTPHFCHPPTIQRMLRQLIGFLFLCSAALLNAQETRLAPTNGIGNFEGHVNIGPSIVGNSGFKYDRAEQTYLVRGEGSNMWFSSDAFQFVWKTATRPSASGVGILFPQ